jgi:hypothetical protein
MQKILGMYKFYAGFRKTQHATCPSCLSGMAIVQF